MHTWRTREKDRGNRARRRRERRHRRRWPMLKSAKPRDCQIPQTSRPWKYRKNALPGIRNKVYIGRHTCTSTGHGVSGGHRVRARRGKPTGIRRHYKRADLIESRELNARGIPPRSIFSCHACLPERDAG